MSKLADFVKRYNALGKCPLAPRRALDFLALDNVDFPKLEKQIDKVYSRYADIQIGSPDDWGKYLGEWDALEEDVQAEMIRLGLQKQPNLK